MIMSKDIKEDDYPSTICTLDGNELKNVKTFKYLGQKFSFNEPYTASTELMTRKMSAITSFFKDDFYRNQAIALQTRVKIFDSLFRSKLTYACQTWSTTQAALKPIEAAYMGQLRKMVRGGTSRKLTPLQSDLPEDHPDQKFDQAYVYTNLDILDITKATSVKVFIDQMQVNWFAHVIRMPNTSHVKRLTFPEHPSTGCRGGQGLLTLKKKILSNHEKSESEVYKMCFKREQHKLEEFRKVKDRVLEN